MMATVSFPPRCAVSVICGNNLISQVYPASVPVEVFIDNVIELLNDELKRRGVTSLDSGVSYELQRVNGTRLDITKTLDELGIEDGAALVLVPAAVGDSYEPHYESLSTGLARIGKKLFTPVTRQTAANTAMGITAMSVLTVLVLALRARLQTESIIPAWITGIFGVTLIAAAIAVWRWWPDHRDVLSSFSWLAVPLVSGSLAAAAPGEVGGAHVFIAALAAGVLSYGVVVMTRRHIMWAAIVMTGCVVVGAVGAVRMWRPIPSQWVGMCILIGLLMIVTYAPTVALWVARIRPPHFGSITGRDVFRRADGQPVDSVSPVIDESSGIDELASVDIQDKSFIDTTPPGAVIAAAARRANSVLTGICVAVAAMLPVAVWVTLIPGSARGGAAVVLVSLFVVIFISRGRAFADRRQAVALVCGASAAVCAGVIRYVVSVPADSGAVLVWGACVVVAYAAAGLVAAFLVPVTRFTPLVRMVAEWVELVAIVVAFPLAAWIGGLFSWIRLR